MNRRRYLQTLAAAVTLRRSNATPAANARFQLAVCAYSFRTRLANKTMSYADVIRLAADNGAHGLDMTSYWLPDTTDETLLPLKKLAYRSGISIYSVGIRARMVQPTPELQSAEVETVRKWLDTAEKLGASHVRIFGGAVPKGVTEDQAVVWAVDTLKRAADLAAKKGIVLGVEDDGGITTNADRTVEIVRKADSPWVGINLDIGNFRDDAYTQIELCAPFATNVHFKSRVMLNHQREATDIPRVLKILGNAGYHGYLSVEYEDTDDAMVAVPKILSQLQQAIGSSRL